MPTRKPQRPSTTAPKPRRPAAPKTVKPKASSVRPSAPRAPKATARRPPDVAPSSVAHEYVGYKNSRLLSPEVLYAGVAEVANLAAAEGVKVVLVGGLAMQMYGSDRLTGDIDFASNGFVSSLPRRRLLTFGGVQTVTPSGIPVDFIVRDDDYRELYEEAVFASPVARSLGVRVVPAKYLAAMKMAAGRDKDMLDLKFLLAQTGLLDLAETRAIIRRFLGPYAAQEFDRVVDEVAWEKHRGEWRPREE